MIKIKAIDQQYTMEEITAIVDEIYPFGEYYGKEHRGKKKELVLEDGILKAIETNEDVTYHTIETNEEYCKKEDLINLFLSLNRCNKKLAFSGIPLTAREKKRLIDERAEAYNQLQEIINPVEPQPMEEKAPLMQITDEAINGLKPYFVSTFKGMGNNPDRFNENLIPALKMCQTKKEVANLLLACFNSASMIGNKRPKSWAKWVEAVCMLFSIDRLPYKPRELERPDYDVKYYWLKPPENRR